MLYIRQQYEIIGHLRYSNKMTQIFFHYPPELMALLKDAIPKLCKSKRDLLLFFRGAGVLDDVIIPYERHLKQNKESFNKYVVTGEILEKLNVKDDKAIRERREILKRITEFSDFSVCWDNDRAAARGLVSQIRDVVNVKDSFTRMKNEKDEEKRKRIEIEQKELNKKKEKLEKIKIEIIEGKIKVPDFYLMKKK